MKHVYALSKSSAASIKKGIILDRSPIISILNYIDTSDVDLFPESDSVLTLRFDDLSPYSKYTHLPECRAMSLEQAYKIITFVDKHKDVDVMRVHCSMGICRSGAVARFISEVLDIDQQVFRDDNPMIQPNDWVLNLLFYALVSFPNGLVKK